MERYSKKIITVIVLSSILFTSMFLGCLDNKKNNTQKITAKNAFNLSLNKANQSIEENPTKTRIGQIWGGGINGDGKASVWHCSFSIVKNSTHLNYFYYKVYGNKSLDLIEKEVRNISGGNPLKNWTLDSDEAMDVAKENPKISEYLNEYDDAEVDHMQLDMWGEYSKDDAVWIISWMYNAGLDNPKNARAIINAHTGEVLYAEADN